MNLIPNPKNPNLENLFLKHMRNSVQVRPMPLCRCYIMRSGSGLRISEVSPLCTKHACSTVEPPSQWSEKNTPPRLWWFWNSGNHHEWYGLNHIGCLYGFYHGFTWMIYELCLFLQSIGMVQSVPLVGKLWRGFAFVSYLPSNNGRRNQDDSLHSLSKTQPADHASDSVGFPGCLFHVLDNRNGSTFRCKSPRSLPGKWRLCRIHVLDYLQA